MDTYPMCFIRRLTSRDLVAAHRLEVTSFIDPWSLRDVADYLTDPYLDIALDEAKTPKTSQFTAFGAYNNNILIGNIFFKYDISNKYVLVTNLAVDEHHRRQGIGTKLMERIKQDANSYGLKMLTLVRETNLDAQLFAKSCGFVWVATFNDVYRENTESGYFMFLPTAKQRDIVVNHSMNKFLE